MLFFSVIHIKYRVYNKTRGKALVHINGNNDDIAKENHNFRIVTYKYF